MTYKCKQVDIGDKCVECLKSTAFGTGLFVNRIPADNDKYIGWLCPECNWYECDRCDERIYDEKRKSECIKYFIGHFKVSQSTAYRWYDKIYNELSIPSIDKANKLAEYKAQVEHQIEKSMKDIEKLPVNEKIKLFSEITKLKKELRKL